MTNFQTNPYLDFIHWERKKQGKLVQYPPIGLRMFTLPSTKTRFLNGSNCTLTLTAECGRLLSACC